MSGKRPENCDKFAHLLASNEKKLGGRIRALRSPKNTGLTRWRDGRLHRPSYAVVFEDGGEIKVPVKLVHERPRAAYFRVKRARQGRGGGK